MLKKSVGRKEVHRRKNVASIASWWRTFQFLLPKNDKKPNDIACTRALRLKTQNSARSKSYLDINYIYIYTYIIPSHTEHNSTTTTTTTTTHAHPYLYIFTYIYTHLYYINLYYIYEYEKETPHLLLYDYYTDVHVIGIYERRPVCVSRIITCFSLFANNKLIITPLLVVFRVFV